MFVIELDSPCILKREKDGDIVLIELEEGASYKLLAKSIENSEKHVKYETNFGIEVEIVI